MKSNWYLIGVLPALAVALTACQGTHSVLKGSDHYLFMYQDYPPRVERFQVCHDVHCENLTQVSLSAESWRQVQAIFKSRARNAAEERQKLAQAIARFETLVGPIAGTFADQPANEGGNHPHNQLDCIAETVNTTTYLTLIEQQDWLRWHTIAEPEHRGLFTMQAAHNSAVIVEKGSGQAYAVDSWFHANGELPEVVTLQSWKAGYDPRVK